MYHLIHRGVGPVVAAWLSVLVFHAPVALAAPARSASSLPTVVEIGRESVLTSTNSAATHLARESAGPDTFDLYGGTGSLAGKFSDPTGTLPDRQGWIGVDVTDVPPAWHASTFNAANLGGHGEGNRAFWCGREAAEVSGWVTPPGYGNHWNATALYESEPMADPSVGQDVALDFLLNHDSEPGYDFLLVEYQTAGTWNGVLALDGTNKSGGDFAAPGVRFSDVATGVVHFDGNDYGDEDRIRIRFRFSSDGAWSDEDGSWPTDGAAQIDDLSITHSGGTFTEDFEGAGPYLVRSVRQPLAGDFSDVYARFADLDPCVENTTPVIGFIDHGQAPPNGPGFEGNVSTGGSTSASWDYGIPGGFVVNSTGGLSNGLVGIHNFVASPEIDWDLPGSTDDGPEMVGARFEVSVWSHLPFNNLILFAWQVRSRSVGADWSEWRNRGVLEGGGPPNGTWQRFSADVTDLLDPDPEQVQLRLGVVDISRLILDPSRDATPSPVFDDVRFTKYRIGGPVLTMLAVDRAQSGFPVSGSIAATTPSERDALDIPFDMAWDINRFGLTNTPGDSLAFSATAILPGTTVADVRMQWALHKNPYFEDALRAAPARSSDQNVDATGQVWTGEVVAEPVYDRFGSLIEGRYAVDLPDIDFLYPGDVLQYYLEATDSDGRLSTLPGDTRGFGSLTGGWGDSYHRAFTVHGLPSIDALGQPTKLIYDDAFDGSAHSTVLETLGQLGFEEGVHFDVYEVQSPTTLTSNGIGSAGAHGATPEQLAGYDTIVVLWGDRQFQLLSDGTQSGGRDKSEDVDALHGWKLLPGPRNTVYFGDNVASALQGPVFSPAVASYQQDIMGVELLDSDVYETIDAQRAPTVLGLLPDFIRSFATFGSCPDFKSFDGIRPGPTAVAGHAWLSRGGSPYTEPAASVVFDRTVQGHRRVDVTFPFGLDSVYLDVTAPNGRSPRAILLREVFSTMDVQSEGMFVDAPALRTASLSVAPNPFNPRTVVEFVVAVRGGATLRVYNVRGELVRTLHDGVLEAGEHSFVWNGEDEAGGRVSSGVYLVSAITSGFDATRKAVVLK